MHNRRNVFILVILLVLVSLVGGWVLVQRNAEEKIPALLASGTIEAVEVQIAPELAGRVAEVYVVKGDYVQPGDPLFRLDDEILRSQRELAAAALETARAAETNAQIGLSLAETKLRTAELALETSQVQFDMALYSAHVAETPVRSAEWRQPSPDEFEQPLWYFEKDEEIEAARAELDVARQALADERANFASLLERVTNQDLKLAEERLSKARAAFLVAQEVLERANAQKDEELKDFAQSLYDAALAELEAAQSDYDQMLTEEASQDILEARARLAVAQARYDAALEHLNLLLTGEHSLQVRTAELALLQAEITQQQADLGVQQAQANLEQAEKAIKQAEAEIKLIDVQLEKLVVKAPKRGVILSKNVEAGEVLQPGAAVMTIGLLEDLHITVYVPEDRYGQISLGQRAWVMVDSFPNQEFSANVIYIADQAEYTPRNVQTAEGRRTTVFAVELSIDDPQGKLKPGMPADVRFTNP